MGLQHAPYFTILSLEHPRLTPYGVRVSAIYNAVSASTVDWPSEKQP